MRRLKRTPGIALARLVRCFGITGDVLPSVSLNALPRSELNFYVL
jgi:hypothetical protein